jgi:hypothetical protein
MNIEHYVLTRFNLGTKPATWHEYRWITMEKWLFPSIEAQTSKNFKFGVIVSKNTEKDLLNRIEKWFPKINGFFLFDTRDGRFKEKITITEDCGWYEEFVKIAHAKKLYLVTTRVDSDDFMMPKGVEIIANNAKYEIENGKKDRVIEADKHFFINYNHNDFWINLEASKKEMEVSPCCTLVEYSKIDTVYTCAHTKLHRRYECDLIDGITWGRNASYKHGVEDFKDVKLSNAISFPGKFDGFNDFIENKTVKGILSGEIDFNE